ncbi:MAG TPA: type IV pilus biogenesis/stability protein PilW [Burkholderiales bacterium]|nr:type IV pilus biogenesis/stability protein PilW [Burkholderiales bacterium]
MRRASLLLALAAALLAACAARQPEGPSADTGTIVGEVGEPRNRARVHTELAGLYYERGSMGIALEELRRATAADPGYAPAYSLFGRVYMDLKENRLAEESFERALRLSPGDAEINHSYGWFLCQTGQEEQSIRYFLQAIRNPLYPTPWISYSAAGLCSLRKDHVKEADEYFQRALRLNADEPTALLKLGGIRYQQGRLEDARNLITRYNKFMTPTAESLWLGLRVERRLGKRVEAQSYADQLRRRYPGSAEYQAMERGSYD